MTNIIHSSASNRFREDLPRSRLIARQPVELKVFAPDPPRSCREQPDDQSFAVRFGAHGERSVTGGSGIEAALRRMRGNDRYLGLLKNTCKLSEVDGRRPKKKKKAFLRRGEGTQADINRYFGHGSLPGGGGLCLTKIGAPPLSQAKLRQVGSPVTFSWAHARLVQEQASDTRSCT